MQTMATGVTIANTKIAKRFSEFSSDWLLPIDGKWKRERMVRGWKWFLYTRRSVHSMLYTVVYDLLYINNGGWVVYIGYTCILILTCFTQYLREKGKTFE